MASSQVALCGIILKLLPLQGLNLTLGICTCFAFNRFISNVFFDMSLTQMLLSQWFLVHIFVNILSVTTILAFKHLQVFVAFVQVHMFLGTL